MKKFLLIFGLAAACLGLSSTVIADLVSQPAPDQYGLTGAVLVKRNNKDSDFYKEWIDWLREHLFGWDRDEDIWVYQPANTGQDDDPGESGSDNNFGDGNSNIDPGCDDFGGISGVWGYEPFQSGAGNNFSGGSWIGAVDVRSYDMSTVPVEQVPVPGAVLLGLLGLSVAGMKLRKNA